MTPQWLASRRLEPWSEGDLPLEAIIPQRAPLLLVDRVAGVRRGTWPAVAASLGITGGEPVLAGHFPGRPVWPGSYTIEGLAQTCALAGRLSSGQCTPEGRDKTAGLVLVAGVKVKLTGVVMPPARLDYFVELSNVVGGVTRFAVEASVGGRQIAVGSIDVVVREEPPGAP